MTISDNTQNIAQDIHELESMGLIEQTANGCWTLTTAGRAAVEKINAEQDERPFNLTTKGRERAAYLLDNKE